MLKSEEIRTSLGTRVMVDQEGFYGRDTVVLRVMLSTGLLVSVRLEASESNRLAAAMIVEGPGE